MEKWIIVELVIFILLIEIQHYRNYKTNREHNERLLKQIEAFHKRLRDDYMAVLDSDDVEYPPTNRNSVSNQ